MNDFEKQQLADKVAQVYKENAEMQTYIRLQVGIAKGIVLIRKPKK